MERLTEEEMFGDVHNTPRDVFRFPSAAIVWEMLTKPLFSLSRGAKLACGRETGRKKGKEEPAAQEQPM